MVRVGQLHNRVFRLLWLSGVGLLVALGWLASFFTLAPLAKIIHSCRRMLAVPPFYLAIGVLMCFLVGIRLIQIALAVHRERKLLRTFLQGLNIECDWPQGLALVAAETGTEQRLTYVHSDKPLAFTYGFIEPRIVISDKMVQMLAENELKAVLFHESCHAAEGPTENVSVKNNICRVVPSALVG